MRFFVGSSPNTAVGGFLAATGDSKGDSIDVYLTYQLALRQDKYWGSERKSISGKDVQYFYTNRAAIAAGFNAGASLITINLGANDFVNGGAAAGNQANWIGQYQAVIDQLHGQCPGARIGIVQPWSRNWDTESDRLAAWIPSVVSGRAWAYVGPDERVILKGADNGATYTVDGIHPTAGGYGLEAAAWITAFGL